MTPEDACRRLRELRAGIAARPWHLSLAAFGAGLGLAGRPGAGAALAAVAALALVAAGAAPLAPLVGILLLAGVTVGAERLEAIDAPGRELRSGQAVRGLATVLDRARPGRFGASVELRLPGGARVSGRLPRGAEAAVAGGPGIEVYVSGVLRLAAARSRTGFDTAGWLRRNGIAAELAIARIRATGRRRGGPSGAIDALRGRAERALGSGLARRDGALARGMVLGQDELIDEATRDDWRTAGLGHLLAVSGQNVMLLAALAFPLLAAAGLPVRLRAVLVAGLVALYVPLAGAGPSLQRAGVMGLAALAALCLARPASRWYALLLAAAATLAMNPRAAGDPGWQLSFAAVAGILLLAPDLRGRLARALPRPFAEGIAVTVAATLATAPLLAFHFGSVPLLGLPANVLALPLVAPVMWLGMVRAALGQLMPAEGPAGAVAEAANDLAGVALGQLIGALAALARAFADVPGATLSLPALSPVAVTCSYAGVAALCLAAAQRLRRAETGLLMAGAAWRRRPWRYRVAVVCALSAAAALGAGPVVSPPGAPDALTVSFLDVGQGDATLIQHPEGGAVLFDGGPPEARVVRLLRGAGVRRLSALVMTHASRDHHGGLREVVERLPVDVVVDGGDGTRDRDFRATVATAVRRGARRLEAVAPLTVRVGAITIRVLSPPSRPPGPPPEDPNPRAVVAVASAGAFDLFLSADAESPALSALRVPDVEAMKAPHHGSADPGLPDLLERLRPEVAAVTVGENDYGHPAPSTVAALRAAGAEVRRTDRDGTVRLTVQDGAMSLTGSAR